MHKEFRGIILSGGGARGAYSAGILAALNAIDHQKKDSIENFYAGSSIGALNSTIAAQGDLSSLITLWEELETQKILGEKTSKISKWKIWRRSSEKPFFYFNKNNIMEIIREYINFDALLNSHLVITATNFKTGKPETFYISKLLPDFISMDQEKSEHRRRLKRYHKINSQDHLEKVLMASAAIPFFLEPVKIGDDYYIDGGVGNNTPLQQAALFARYLNNSQQGNCATVICNLLDSGRFVLPDDYDLDMSNIIRRTVDIFQNVITNERMSAWEQINRSVKELEEFLNKLINQIESSVTIQKPEKKNLLKIINSYHFSTSLTPRQELELRLLRPSEDIELENALDFKPSASRSQINAGFLNTLNIFQTKGIITLDEKDKLENLENYGV
jgi:predicted acylesterase/phospholipase RssA